MSAGFDAPNYTQVPNALFDMMPQMSEAELRCTLTLVRQIIGWHKEKPEPVSYSQLEAKTGMSRQGVIAGIEAGVKRGCVVITGTGKRGVNLYTLNIEDQSTTLTSQGKKKSTKKTSRKPDQSTTLTSTSQPSRPDLVNEVDSQKKEKETTKEKEYGDTPAVVTGDEVPVDPITEPERPRNVTLDTLVEAGFEIDPHDRAGVASVARLAGWFAAWCDGHAVKEGPRSNRMIPGADPVWTPDELRAMLHWYRQEKGLDMPNSALVFVRYASQYRAAHPPTPAPAVGDDPLYDPMWATMDIGEQMRYKAEQSVRQLEAYRGKHS